MIELRNINFAYPEQNVLQNVSFKVGINEALVIMGPSGCGKSTILRLILGLECPSSGEILIDGTNICVAKMSEKRELRKKIGMVFQEGALFDSMTVGENIGYYLTEHTDMIEEEIEQKVVEMLGFVGMVPDEVIDKLPEQLSGGMRRRVAIGRALLSTNPNIMLFDEPTTGLDPYATRNVVNLIKKLYEVQDMTTVVVTHKIADAIMLADRFVVVHGGEVAFAGDLMQLRDAPDRRVQAFLDPYRNAFEGVLKSKFIGDTRQ